MEKDCEKVDCPVCFGIEEDEPCDACEGRGYFLSPTYKQPVPPFDQISWDALPPVAQKIITEVEDKRHTTTT